MKVLVVDDEPDAQHLFRQNFRSERRQGKIIFEFALSAEEALELLDRDDQTDIVLILSDINMPGITGLELLKVVKERFPDIKVFMITAYDDEEKQQTAQKYGSDEYFTKPVDFDYLREKMFAIMQKK